MRKVTKKTVALGIAIPFLTVGLIMLISHPVRRQLRVTYETNLARLHATPDTAFPSISTTGLTPLQQNIIHLSKQEYDKKPISFDANVLKYSQGSKEAWCADFASWILRQSGQPLNNPNSGSWRIPGVNTLQEYYQAKGRYVVAGTYKPQVGDVAIYLHDRSHTNIVIAVDGNTMTTVGGNEDGHIRVHKQAYKLYTEGLSGFGKLAAR